MCLANECPDGEFWNDATQNCTACLADCKKCDNTTTCNTCNDGFWYNTTTPACDAC